LLPLVLAETPAENFEGDRSIERRVMGAVDDAHPAFAELRLDDVAVDSLLGWLVATDGSKKALESDLSSEATAGTPLSGPHQRIQAGSV